jgi:hypothetical protein
MAPTDDYGVNKKGYIKLLRKTDDKTDKLTALDAKGKETAKSIMVSKGILSNVKEGKSSNDTKSSYMKVQNKSTEAKGLFEFFAKNTNVEWGQVNYTNDGVNNSFIGTSHDPTTEEAAGEFMDKVLPYSNYDVKEHIHSHPQRKSSYFGPSGFHPRDKNNGNRKFAEWKKANYPKEDYKLKVYEVPLKKYIEYNENGIIK